MIGETPWQVGKKFKDKSEKSKVVESPAAMIIYSQAGKLVLLWAGGKGGLQG